VTQESEDLYLFAPGCDIVKVRDGLMDIKALREVLPNGLEQWVPTMKAGFPLAAADVEAVFAALRQPVPSLTRAEYTFDQLMDELIRPMAAITVAPVRKLRVRYTVDGCMAEFTEVEVAGRKAHTIAIEDEDPEAVFAAERHLGLGGYANVSYAMALAALIAGTPVRYAAVDVGTNSVKLHIADRATDGTWTRIVDRAEVTQLGEGLAATGRIGAEPLERTVTAIEGMAAEARAAGAVVIAAVTTAGVRAAANRDEVIDEVRQRTGLELEVISGDEEARLAYLASRVALGSEVGTVAAVDTGGGSSQFTFGTQLGVTEQFSVAVGAVAYTERFGLSHAVSAEVVGEARAAIAEALGRLRGRPALDRLLGMGGAVTNIAAVYHGLATYDPDVVQGTVLEASEVDRQIELYRERDAEARREIVGLQENRAEVILAGACIVRTVMELLAVSSLTVSDRGLRHGVLAAWFGEPPA
jgi:exopolyphosphatase/guanosine-5'-triphosphate,3'-diphosphate pyrophosphatase